MKKILSALVALCAVTLLFFGTALPGQGMGLIDGVYSAWQVYDSFGFQPAEALGGYFFDDGVWTLEYYDLKTETFAPMTAYFKNRQEDWALGSWSDFYTATAQSAFTRGDYTYCSVLPNGRMHPGAGAASVLTFIAPAEGTVNFSVVFNAYSEQNTDGTAITVWQNDIIVGPNGKSGIITHEMGNYTLQVLGLTVKSGDRIRFGVGPNDGHQQKGIAFVSAPSVTYVKASSMAIRQKPSDAPAPVWVSSAPGAVLVSWNGVKNAVGYNIYVNGEKKNETPVDSIEYSFQGSVEDTSSVTVTAVGPDGSESVQSVGGIPGKRTASDLGVSYLEKLPEPEILPENTDSSEDVTQSTVSTGAGDTVTDGLPNSEEDCIVGPSDAPQTGSEEVESPVSSVSSGENPSNPAPVPWHWVGVGGGVFAVAAGTLLLILLKKKK